MVARKRIKDGKTQFNMVFYFDLYPELFESIRRKIMDGDKK